MTAGGRRSWLAAALLASAGFAVLAHAAILEGVSPTVGALLSLVPLLLLGTAMVRRARSRIALLAAGLAAAVALWLGWSALERHFQHLFFVEHAGANLVLAIVFGRTLAGGREALVTIFARLVHGPLPPEVVAYTRRVTLAWTIFFATLFALSCALYLGGWLAAWSFLANIASPLLIAAMFGIEYFVRHRALPHWERVGILHGVRAFSRHFAGARLETPR